MSGFFSKDNPPPLQQQAENSPPGNVVVQEPTGVDGATASFYGRGPSPELQEFEEDAKQAADAAAASAAAAGTSATNAANSAATAASLATSVSLDVEAVVAAGAQADQAADAAEASANSAAASAATATARATSATTSASQAAASATNAANSAAAAGTSATNAAGSATNSANSASLAAGSASNAANSATAAGTSATNAANSATAAAGSATAAGTSATNAANSATSAGNSATAAGTSATNAANSATAAGNSATAAAASQSAAAGSATNAAGSAATAATRAAEASTSATNAAASATSAEASNQSAIAALQDAVEAKDLAEDAQAAAAASATNASTSATAAGNSATAASTSATNAANSASAASTSATNAANSATSAAGSATNAATSATNAAASQTAAANSATSAAGSASTATTRASEAAASATGAAASASTATTRASEAATSASNAATSAGAAATSATNAANSATAAGTSASNAAGSATAAANSATAAAGSATSASSAQAAAESARDATLAAFDSFDDRYLGTKTSNPTVDNDGNALVAGALYFNSVAGEMRVWTGSVWAAAYVSGAGVLLIANNLSDVASASAARANLGLGNVENKSSATIRSEITSGNVTTALGYTPYNATNPAGYISGINSSMVTTALGFTPYNSSNPAGYISGITSGMVTTALGYTPYNSSNPAGYITAAGVVRSAGGLGNPADWNAITTAGVYTIATASLTGTSNPGGYPYGTLIVTADGERVTQTYIRHDSNNTTSVRSKFNASDWMAWATTVSSANFNSYSPTLTGGGASGTWGINVTGNASTVSSITSGQVTTALGYTPANRAGDTFTGVVNSPNGFASGFFGSFITDRFTVGGESVLHYGLTVTSSGKTYASGYYGLSLATVGTERLTINTSGNVTANVDIRAPIFYDSNDTGFFIDPNGGSRFVVQGNVDGGPSRGIYMWNSGDTNWGIYMGQSGAGRSLSGGTASASLFGATAHQIRFRVVNWDGSGFGWENSAETPLMSLSGGTGDLFVRNSIRTPIFYDSNNTAFYLDPNSTSVVQRLGVRGQFEYPGSINSDWDSGYYHFQPSNNTPGGSWGHAHIIRLNADWNVQMFFPTSNTNEPMWIRRRQNGTYSAWRRMLQEDEWIGSKYLGSDGAIYGTIFYDSNNTARYFDGTGGFNLVGGSGNRVTFYTDDSGFRASNPEGTGADVRLGAAWGRPGSYSTTSYTVGSESTIHFWTQGVQRGQIDSSGNLTMTGNVTAYSDARLKKDVTPIEGALELVSKMRGVRYTRIDTENRNVGVIAQEMAEVCPEVVQQGVGDDDTLSVAYGNLVGVLIEAIKELDTKFETLKKDMH